jgi:hypothetical protein
MFFHVSKKFYTMENFSSNVDFSLQVYGTITPSRLNLIGYAGVNVVGAMLRWKGVGSIKIYNSGDTTALDHPFTGDWGHEIFFIALAK